MIRINLLPFRAARKKENIRRQVSIFLLSFALVALGMVYYHINLSSRVQGLTVTVNDTKEQVAKYDEINREIENIKRELDILEKRTGIIENLELGRRESIRLLDIMTDTVIPRRMQLTSLEAKEDIVTIKGIAVDNKTVADFMTRLDGSGLFVGVDLKTLKRQRVDENIELKGFEIICSRAPLNSERTEVRGQ